MLILYREKDLDKAYKIDCKSKTKDNKPLLKREEFRYVYENLLDLYFTKALEKTYEDKVDELVEHIMDKVNSTLENNFEIKPEE